MFMQILQGSQQLGLSGNVKGVNLDKYVMGGNLNLVIKVNSGSVVEGHDLPDPMPSPPTVGKPESYTAIYHTVDLKGGNVTLYNYGTILGTNGWGGYVEHNGGDNGGQGGACLGVSCPVILYNYGNIESGGGGGACSEDGFESGNDYDTVWNNGGAGYPTPYSIRYKLASNGKMYDIHYYGPNVPSYKHGSGEGSTRLEDVDGGDCYGANTDGETTWSGHDGYLGGAKGFSIDTHGNGVTVKVNTGTLLGDFN